MNEQSQVFVNKLKDLVESGSSIHIHEMFGKLALDIMCETSIGVKVNAQLSDQHPYVDAVSK